MKLTVSELEFLSAWAREEWEPACYQMPAHRLQLTHRISGGSLIVFIKAWTESEEKKDQEILSVSMNSSPAWPWQSENDFQNRLEEAARDGTRRANLRREASAGRREDFEKYLAAIPDVPPPDNDRID